MRTPLANWAGNHTYRATQVHEPTTIDGLRAVVAGASRLRALGSRHCFNDIADGDALVLLDRMPPLMEIDAARSTVTVGASTRYGTLAGYLHANGWALDNLASLPHISVAGSVATATHGSGVGHRNLAASVVGLTLMTADGSTVDLVEDDEDFAGAVVSLGALGVVTEVTLRIEPTYDVAQVVHLDLPWVAVLEHVEEIAASADSVSLFTDWRGDTLAHVWRKNRTSGSRATPNLFGARPATEDIHPLAGLSPRSTTQQMGVPGPWHERWPHFRMAFTPSAGQELQTEYFVSREHTREALEAVRALGEQVSELLFISEIRTVAADDLWLSTAYRRDSVALHFTWQPRQQEVDALLPTIERALEPFDPRPHWGKRFSPTVVGDAGRLESRYPKLNDFRALVARLDPQGTFRNEYLERHVLGGA